MINYKFEIFPITLKFLEKQFQKQQEQILKSIKILPHTANVKRLKGYEKRYCLRVGDIRAIYEIDNEELIVLVLDIDNRRYIYKKLE